MHIAKGQKPEGLKKRNGCVQVQTSFLLIRVTKQNPTFFVWFFDLWRGSHSQELFASYRGPCPTNTSGRNLLHENLIHISLNSTKIHMSRMELLIVQSVFDEFFWRFRSHWFVFFVEPFVFLRRNTNRRRCMQSGCVFSLPDTSQPKSFVLDLYDSVRWEKKCVWVFSIVDMSCWCGLCTSISFQVYEKAVRNNDEYPNLSIDNEPLLVNEERL